ncbi:MAG: hypothetical protein ABIT71_23945 [Vicinamibacteraceae bacterium]
MVRLLARLRHTWWDVAIAATFFLVGALLARSVLLVQPRPVFFYETFLSAAVLDACGLGFHEYEAGRSPPVLDDFLKRKTSRLSCDALPTDQPLRSPNWFTVMHRYLAWLTTIIWRVRGVDWNALATMFEAASGAVAALGYTIGRLTLNRWWASALGLAVATSALNLGYVPWFRDYAKAPFLLASLALCGWMVTRTRTTRSLVALSALQGMVIGIGLGFRTDVLVAIPLFLLVVGIFLPRDAGLTLKWRAAALAAFVVSFLLAGWPMLRGYGKGGNMPHVMLLGLAQPFSVPLGVAPAHYVVSPTYWDFQTEVQTRTYSRAVGGDDWAAVSTVAYDRATSRYLRAVVTALPADILLRTYAAVLTVFKLPFSPQTTPECRALQGSLAGSACAARDWVLSPLHWLPVLPACIFLLAVTASQPRLAGFLCAALAVYAGTSMLQYDARHVFHLEIVPLWTLAFAGQHLGTVARGMRRALTGGSGARRPALRRWVSRAAWATAALIVIPAGALIIVRGWQARHLSALFERYVAADVQTLPVAWLDDTPAIRRISLESIVPAFEPWSPGQPTVRAEILRVVLGGSSCGGRDVVMTLRYRTTFTTGVITVPAVLHWQVPPDGAATPVFLPVYRALVGEPTDQRPSAEFLAPGIDFAPADAACVQSLARVRSPMSFPLQFAVALPPDWRHLPHYQRLAAFGGPVPVP